MSFVGRWWRALNTQYDILDTWPVTFFTLTLTLAISIPSLLYYTYAGGERADTESYYSFPYSSHWYYLSAEQLRSLQLWRLPASQFVFPTSAELVFGTPLLLLLRTAEWQLADRHWKRATLLLSVMLLCMGGDALLVLAGGVKVQSGPYWLVFFLLPIYAVHVQPEWTFKVFKLSLSNKAVVYFLALHLLLVLVPASLLAACLPLGLALLYLMLRFCVSGGLSSILHPNRPQGMRVGRRGEPTGYRLAAPGAGGSARSAAAAGGGEAARGAPRPTSQYEKLLANAQASKVTGGGTGVDGSELDVETRDVLATEGAARQANEVGYHSRHTQSMQDESLVSNTATTSCQHNHNLDAGSRWIPVSRLALFAPVGVCLVCCCVFARPVRFCRHPSSTSRPRRRMCDAVCWLMHPRLLVCALLIRSECSHTRHSSDSRATELLRRARYRQEAVPNHHATGRLQRQYQRSDCAVAVRRCQVVLFTPVSSAV